MKNLKGKTRPTSDPYEVITAPDPFGGYGDWTWRVLKHYQSTKAELSNEYARVFCEVDGYEKEMGDVYISAIPGYRNMLIELYADELENS